MKRLIGKKILCFFIFFSTIFHQPLNAEIKMQKIFSDNMILQQKMPIKVWGTSSPDAEIDVDFAGQKKSTKANKDGVWTLHLKEMSASKIPRDMTIFENGSEAKKIKNILVGEVWIAGGQSNMEFGLKGSSDGAKAIERAKYPNMRYFSQYAYNTDNSHVPLKDSVKGQWRVVSEKNAMYCSAVGFYFAEKLMKDLNVPVGIIYVARGATSMIAWIPESNLGLLNYTKSQKENFDKALAKYDYMKALNAHKKKMANAKIEDEKRKVEGKPKIKRAWNFHIEPRCNTPWAIGTTPSFMYNTMVAPISGFTARGVIWYQGEGDSDDKSRASFEEQMKLVVDSWRQAFENKNMHFYIVQLASFRSGESVAKTRWAQLKSRDIIKNFGVVNIIDRGDNGDIHPRYKTEVGTRLETLALREVYGKKNAHPYSPEFKNAKYEADIATVELNTFGRKLVTKGEPRGFQVLVNDKWIDAKPELKDANIVVKSPSGGEVKGVRYLWKGLADDIVWLFNEDGLPAFSFIDKVK